MISEKLERINFLAKKAKSEGLSLSEQKEQKELRSEYIAEYRQSLKQILDNTYIMDEKGNKTKVEPKK